MAQSALAPISVKEAVYRLQLSLLDGAATADSLYGAGAVLSRADYSDVVTERSIANLCGYPLCPNPLPSDRPRKGRYRISLKEHRVYDLQETFMFCSQPCVVASKTFEAGLSDERCAVVDPARIEALIGLRDGSEVRIEERSGERFGVFEESVGPSNAIEGYVPRSDRRFKKSLERGSKATSTLLINDTDFASAIITEDEYTVSKMPSDSVETGVSAQSTETGENLAKSVLENQFTILETPYTPAKRNSESISRPRKAGNSKISTRNEVSIQETSRSSEGVTASDKQSVDEVTEKLSGISLKSSLKTSQKTKLSRSVTWADEKSGGAGRGKLCEVREIKGIKGIPTRGMKAGPSDTRAKKGDSSRSMSIFEVEETGDTKEDFDSMCGKGIGDIDEFLRLTSAEACAMALNVASEAVASEEVEISNAISEAGIIILPPLDNVVEDVPMEEDDNRSASEQAPMPNKPESGRLGLFNPEDSWFDTPPDGFNLTLSTFARMWNALFEWTTSSTLAYIYGRDESLHEEYQSVNGREYLQKVVLGDGRSSEIKQTLGGSLARALPGLVAELRLPSPVSSLELGMGRLLETMSFVEALPPFRMKQWQVIVLLFIEALSVYRLPALTPHMANRRMLFHKVLDGAQISADEYEVMKDLMIPLGRTPHFSAQSGA